jgi:hypothetical protein
MRESRFLCLAVSRRDGGNCIAGVDIDSGEWIRPINARTHGAFGDFDIFVGDGITPDRRILKLLDVLQLHLDRYVGNSVQPENWEIAPGSYEDAYMILRRFDDPKDKELLIARLDRDGPLLHSCSNRIATDDPLLKRGLSHSLSIIRPEKLHWKVAPHPTYANKLRIEADFCFDDDQYCISVTDPIWEARCKRCGRGRHQHSTVAGNADGEIFLTVSLAEVPLHGFHYKLVAGVVTLPA